MEQPFTFETAEVANLLQQLAKSSQELSAYTDALNNDVSYIEEKLNDLNLGVSTDVDFKGTSLYPRLKLAYRRRSIKWGFMIEYESTNWSFGEAPRELRIKAAPHIIELLKKLKTVAYALEEQLRTQSAFVHELATSLGRSDKNEGER